MLDMTNHQGNTNQNCNELSPRLLEWLLARWQETSGRGDVEERKPVRFWWECKQPTHTPIPNLASPPSLEFKSLLRRHVLTLQYSLSLTRMQLPVPRRESTCYMPDAAYGLVWFMALCLQLQRNKVYKAVNKYFAQAPQPEYSNGRLWTWACVRSGESDGITMLQQVASSSKAPSFYVPWDCRSLENCHLTIIFTKRKTWFLRSSLAFHFHSYQVKSERTT